MTERRPPDPASSRTLDDGHDAATVQTRTLRVLVSAQTVGTLGGMLGGSVGALVASRVMGLDGFAGLVQSCQVLGSALAAATAARLSAGRGRRVGLSTSFSVAAAGAVLAAVAASRGWFALLLIGSTLFGAGSAAGLQARFAATDLAPEPRRARALSLVVWAMTVGAVLGPNLVEPTSRLAGRLGLEPLAGPYLVAAGCFGVAATVIGIGLRPDPWLLARRLDPARGGAAMPGQGSLREGWRLVAGVPTARLGLVSIALAHTVMVSVMVMTPVHMDHGAASLTVIGLVISVHVAGMFAFAPVMGWLADRAGHATTVVIGGATLVVACLLAAASPEGSSPTLGAGLFLLGLGWSACLVAGSALLTDGVPAAQRIGVQAASDVAMNLSAAIGGALAGVVVAGPGFATLAIVGAVPAAAVVVNGWRGRTRTT